MGVCDGAIPCPGLMPCPGWILCLRPMYSINQHNTTGYKTFKIMDSWLYQTGYLMMIQKHGHRINSSWLFPLCDRDLCFPAQQLFPVLLVPSPAGLSILPLAGVLPLDWGVPLATRWLTLPSTNRKRLAPQSPVSSPSDWLPGAGPCHLEQQRWQAPGHDSWRRERERKETDWWKQATETTSTKTRRLDMNP